MSDVRVKICGITNLADARYCAGAGADYLGFIQSESSPRYVNPELAGQIIEWVAGIQTVGVFVDAAPEYVNATAEAAGFDLVQLHGDEPPDYCSEIHRPVIKAIRIRATDRPEDVQARLAAYVPHVHAFLFDTYAESAQGGTGETFPWDIVRGIDAGRPIFLAGGLTPANVADAVDAVRPYAIDVASGVEESPGRKDLERIDALFAEIASLREV